MSMQGLSGILMGPDHARRVMEWETAQGPTLLRVGAVVALVAGVFMVLAVTGHRSDTRAKPS
jgi:hypothetical protein